MESAMFEMNKLQFFFSLLLDSLSVHHAQNAPKFQWFRPSTLWASAMDAFICEKLFSYQTVWTIQLFNSKWMFDKITPVVGHVRCETMHCDGWVCLIEQIYVNCLSSVNSLVFHYNGCHYQRMDSTVNYMHWKLMLNLLNICLITLPKTHFFSIVFAL